MSDFRSGFVAVVGKPNVGKSTLVNLMLKFPLAVVTPKPQTTRSKILGVLNGENYQIALFDTPGILVKEKHLLHKRMIEDAVGTIDEADLILMVTEPTSPEEEDLLIIERLNKRKARAILAINKIDLVKTPDVLPLIEHYSKLFPFLEIVPISALHGVNIDDLLEVIVENLPRGEPLFPEDYLTDKPLRFFVKEIIRGVIYERFGEEIPYSIAIQIDEFDEKDPEKGGKDYIKATIFVEKESQKPIILGKKGEAIKKVGTLARKRIESFLGRPVFLELWVKVKPKWRKDPAFLRTLSY